MSIESDLVAALGPLVAGRVHRAIFPQPQSVPVWPAVRFTRVSGTPDLDICGGGDESTDDVLYQFDIVAKTLAQADALTAQLVAAMHTFSTPNARVARRDGEFDPDTKTFRVSLDYLIQLSSS